jgi:hypothetical protein
MKLIKVQLKHFWDQGYITGFLSKAEVERVLKNEFTNRCMLLRFCDSQLGAISCSYLREGRESFMFYLLLLLFSPDRIVEHLNPYTNDDLVYKDLTLDKRIDPAHNQILTGIKHIYPNYSVTDMLQSCAKARAQKFCTLGGYTGTMVVTVRANATNSTRYEYRIILRNKSRNSLQ